MTVVQVTGYGWSSYLRANPRPSCSLSKARQLWLPAVRARYDVTVDSAWTHPHFVARPLSRMWAGKLQPVMAISPHRLIVGAGSSLYSYAFGAAKSSASSPPIVFEGVVSLLDDPEHARNITAISFIHDDGAAAILDVAFQDGAIERTRLFNTRHIAGGAPVLSCTRNKGAHMPGNDFVESISVDAGSVLALSTNGHARLSSNHTDFSGAATTHALINLQSRSWVAHLCMEASTPYAAFGTASTTPLNIYAVADGGALVPRPAAILHTKRGADLPPDKLPSSAVYGLARGPPNSPWGSSPQILVSGWFDGQVRCYDLRSSARAAPDGAPGGATHLRPVLSLADRWSYEPIYSVACGGGSAAHIAAGTARHSVVSFWDVRAPATSWSVHAPGNDPSPVYSVVLESSRFFGVTQSRPFVYDFVSARSNFISADG